MAENLTFYMTSVTSSRETKSQQNEIKRILDSHGIPYDSVDISIDKCLLDKMREKAGNPSAVPPQLFRGEKYIGGFQELMDAVENGNLNEFLEVQK